jgi:hypothetical protein
LGWLKRKLSHLLLRWFIAAFAGVGAGLDYGGGRAGARLGR